MPTSFHPLEVADRERDVHPRLQEFIQFFDEAEEQILQYALKLCHYRQQDAEELVQEGWLRAVQRFESYENGNFAGWFSTIMHNACIDQSRRKQREKMLFLPTGIHGAEKDILDEHPDPTTIEEEELPILWHVEQAIDNLQPDDREVADTFRSKEAARDYRTRHSINENTFKSRRRLVREKLRYEIDRLLKW